MKRAIALAFALALFPAAFAGASDRPSTPIPPPPTPGSIPTSVGAPHVCLDYPPEAVAAHAEGTTTVGFTVTETGNATSIHVVQSSGTPSLDDAAVTCASHWLYRPAMKADKPVALPWKAQVRWEITAGNDATQTTPKPLSSHACQAPSGVSIPRGAATALRLHITMAGVVADARIKVTSGNSELDKTAVNCALTWHYTPGTNQGQPTDFQIGETLTWRK